MHKILTTILYNFIVTLIYIYIYIANTIHWWRAAFDCMGHGNACIGSYNVRVHLPSEGTVAHLPCECTMTHLLTMALWHIYLVMAQWHMHRNQFLPFS